MAGETHLECPMFALMLSLVSPPALAQIHADTDGVASPDSVQLLEILDDRGLRVGVIEVPLVSGGGTTHAVTQRWGSDGDFTQILTAHRGFAIADLGVMARTEACGFFGDCPADTPGYFGDCPIDNLGYFGDCPADNFETWETPMEVPFGPSMQASSGRLYQGPGDIVLSFEDPGPQGLPTHMTWFVDTDMPLVVHPGDVVIFTPITALPERVLSGTVDLAVD